MADALRFRFICPGDLHFLEKLYSTTREEELSLVDWADEQKKGFIEQQFDAQRRCYEAEFPKAEFQLILRDERPIGRLYVDRRAKEIHIIDITLLPEHRGRGIGGGIMEKLLAEAAEAGKAVRLHVEKFNRAVHLYQRLGFSVLEDRGTHLLMEWAG